MDPRTKKTLLAAALLLAVTLACPPWLADSPHFPLRTPPPHWDWIWAPPPVPAHINWSSLCYEWMMLAASLIAFRFLAPHPSDKSYKSD